MKYIVIVNDEIARVFEDLDEALNEFKKFNMHPDIVSMEIRKGYLIKDHDFIECPIRSDLECPDVFKPYHHACINCEFREKCRKEDENE